MMISRTIVSIFLLFSLFAAGLSAVCAEEEKGDGSADARPNWKFEEGEFSPLFPFKIQKGSVENITNVQTWGAPWSDAGTGGGLTVRDGRFWKGDDLFRFMGTNLCFSANFLDSSAAERLADTLARFGIRVVRLHHMDSHDIWGKNFSRTQTEIDPEQLDRLDYLIAQLEKRGVYVNINLHVSRHFDERDGFKNSESYHHQCKGIDFIEPRMIELQKRYAHDLLTHVNPYTGRAYTDDPGVAMVEINNENSIVASWFWGDMDILGSPYNDLYRRLWNSWLMAKYGSTSQCYEAWGISPESRPAGETIEDGTVPTLPVAEKDKEGNHAICRDFVAFLIDKEKTYWDEMRDYVKKELGVKSPVTGSQLQYGSFFPQAAFDYSDNHAYWHHPVFPRKQWSLNDWFVQNLAMVNDAEGGTVSSLAVNRVVGKPLTVSEYDHAYPILYGAEGNLIVSAVAAFQGWTGINHFAWSHSDGLDPDFQTLFFDMVANQAKLVHVFACRAMLERGDVTAGPGKFAYTQSLTEQAEQEMIADLKPGWSPVANRLAQDKTLALVCWSGLQLNGGGFDADLPDGVTNVSQWGELPEEFGRPEQGEIRNEFGQLIWNKKIPGAGYFQVDTPGVKVFTGFVRDRSFAFEGMTLAPGKTRLDWTTVSVTAATPETPAPAKTDGITTLAPGRYLIAATGLVQNTGTVFVEYGENQITTAGAYGGSLGGAPVLCEGIPLTVTLSGISAEQVAVFALDEAGNRKGKIPVAAAGKDSIVKIGPEYQTLWYEMVIRGTEAENLSGETPDTERTE